MNKRYKSKLIIRLERESGNYIRYKINIIIYTVNSPLTADDIFNEICMNGIIYIENIEEELKGNSFDDVYAVYKRYILSRLYGDVKNICRSYMSQKYRILNDSVQTNELTMHNASMKAFKAEFSFESDIDYTYSDEGGFSFLTKTENDILRLRFIESVPTPLIPKKLNISRVKYYRCLNSAKEKIIKKLNIFF